MKIEESYCNQFPRFDYHELLTNRFFNIHWNIWLLTEISNRLQSIPTKIKADFSPMTSASGEPRITVLIKMSTTTTLYEGVTHYSHPFIPTFT